MTLELSACRGWEGKPPAVCKSSIIVSLLPDIWVSSFQWNELNPLSSPSLPSFPSNKDDSRGPECRAKISLSSLPPPTSHSSGNRQDLGGQYWTWDSRTVSEWLTPVSWALWVKAEVLVSKVGGRDTELPDRHEGHSMEQWLRRVLCVFTDCAVSIRKLINCNQKQWYQFIIF